MSAPRAAEHLREAVRRADRPARARDGAAFALAHVAAVHRRAPSEGGELARARRGRAAAPELADLRPMLESVELHLGLLRRRRPGRARARSSAYRDATGGDGLGAKMLAGARRSRGRAGGGPASGVRGARARGAGRRRAARRAAAACLVGRDRRADRCPTARDRRSPGGRARRGLPPRRRVFGDLVARDVEGALPAGAGDLEQARRGAAHRARAAGAVGLGRHRRAPGRAALLALARVTRRGDPARRARRSARPRRPRTSPTARTSGARTRRSCCSPRAAPQEALALAEQMGAHGAARAPPGLEAVAVAQGARAHALGRRDEAIAAIEAELALARAVGAPAA